MIDNSVSGPHYSRAKKPTSKTTAPFSIDSEARPTDPGHCARLIIVASGSGRPAIYYLRGALFAPAPLSLPPLIPLRHVGDGLCLVFPL
jgi:hypothetical protein